MSNRKYFGTDGIRGRVGDAPITPEFVLKLGWAAGKVLARHGSRKIIIGKDTRISGYMLESALEAGLAAAGLSASFTGPMPTPAIAYLTRAFRAEAGIVISASHNPFYDNGIKFFSIEGTKLPDDVEEAIEAEMEKELTCVDSAELGKASRIVDAAGRYIEFCKGTFPNELSLGTLKVVVDCAHGATYHIAPNVFRELGAKVIAIGCEPDGLNINEQVGATDVRALQARVLAEREKMLMEAEKEKMRANLLRAISHDLRTPLTSIIGSSTVYLENGSSLPEVEKNALVRHILEDSNWLLNMVENLLSVTRINNETAKVTKTSEPVEEVLSEAMIRLKKRLPDANIHVRVPEEFLMVPMDAVLIEQVLINLLENAVVHAESTEPIECYVESLSDYAIFHVRDYGVGIPPEKLATIFDGSSSTTSTSPDGRKGMGIGLSICKTIILAHGGEIKAINHTRGAEFYFTLPKEDK